MSNSALTAIEHTVKGVVTDLDRAWTPRIWARELGKALWPLADVQLATGGVGVYKTPQGVDALVPLEPIAGQRMVDVFFLTLVPYGDQLIRDQATTLWEDVLDFAVRAALEGYTTDDQRRVPGFREQYLQQSAILPSSMFAPAGFGSWTPWRNDGEAPYTEEFALKQDAAPPFTVFIPGDPMPLLVHQMHTLQVELALQVGLGWAFTHPDHLVLRQKP